MAWVSLDRFDNDPVTLDVARDPPGVEPLGQELKPGSVTADVPDVEIEPAAPRYQRPTDPLTEGTAMSITTLDRSPQHQTRADDRRLVVAGIVAGPLFVASGLAQALTRDGFDLRIHALSQLSTGDLGWVQMLTFIATGVGLVALGVAVLRSRDLVTGRRTVAVGVMILGVGLTVAGLFPTDPAHGFPAGTSGDAGAMSWHGVVHSTAAVVAFLGLAVATGAATVHAVRGRAVVPAILSGLTTIVLLLPSPPQYVSIQLALTGLVALTWTTALAVRLYRGSTVHGGGAR